MTDGTPPPMPDGPPSAPRRTRTNTVIIAAAAAVIAAVVATGIVVVESRDESEAPAAASSPPGKGAVTAAAEEPDSEPTYTVPDADSFTMTLRTTERQCFGSAGCNVTVEPSLSYDGLSEDLDPGAVYEITYEISGDESGPVIETAELSDRTSLNYTESTISTASAGVKVSVKITDITTQGE